MPTVQKKETIETAMFKYGGGIFDSNLYMIVTISCSRLSTKRKKPPKERVIDPV